MTQDLLSLNIDGLFEKMSLEETQQVLRKMRQEVEKKREDLRVLVGNRYRDLIDAADTIGDMKTTAEEVTNHLLVMEDKLNSLKHRQLVGFKTDASLAEKNKETTEAKKRCRILAAQIKLLMELPEMIWKQIESGNLSNAAQIQQLGFHLHTGLSVENGISGSEANIQQWFPVINQQKVALVSFTDIIVRESTNQLKDIRLSVESATDSCCALMLFQGKESSQMMREFLQFRSEALSNRVPSLSGTKQQLEGLLQFIISSFASLHALFIEGFPEINLPQGLLSDSLKRICQTSAEPTVQLLSLTPGFMRQLPAIVTEFRSSTRETWTSLPISLIRSEVQNWYETVRSIVPKQLSQLLSCVSQIKTLANLRDLAFTTLQTEPYADQWKELTHRLLGSNICLWEELFLPVFIEKIGNIIQGKLNDGLEIMRQSIEKNYVKFDLKPWLWGESPNDLPQSSVVLPKSTGLFMKTRCYMPTVQQLCGTWDQRMGLLLEDLAHYQEGDVEGGSFLPFSKYGKRAEINMILQKQSITSVKKLISFFDCKDFSDNRIVFALKFVVALTDLCPNMKLCVDRDQDGEHQSWSTLLEFLRCSSLDWFHLWKDDVLDAMKHNLEVQLQMNTVASALGTTPMWSEITIQEEEESGGAVQSQIRVPMNPSFPLQQGLFKICQEINNLGPHAIPKKAQQFLMEDAGSAILKCYESYVSLHSTVLPQAVAFQLLFDVRFIGGLLLPRDNKPLQEKARSICESLEGRVDPFDLDVFNPHIQNHVKRAVQRLQFVFGPLLTADRHAILWAARAANPAGSKKPETPSVVGLVSSSQRFLLLPLVNRSNSEAHSNSNKLIEASAMGNNASSTQMKSSRSKSDFSSANASSMARSSAAAFFGAMSSSWSSSIFGDK